MVYELILLDGAWENSMDGGALWAKVHWFTESQKWCEHACTVFYNI